VYGIASTDEEAAKRAHLHCMESACPHPRILALKSEPLLSEGQRWQDGMDIFADECKNLCEFAAELAWAWNAERPVEAMHRRVKQRGYGAPNHGEAYQSYGLRRSELLAFLDEDPDALDELSRHALRVRTSQSACRALGLGAHDVAMGVQAGKHASRVVQYAQVIYHADPATLYGDQAITITRQDDPPEVPRFEEPGDLGAGAEDADIGVHGEGSDATLSDEATATVA